MKIYDNEITYKVDSNGYMLYYHNKPIGGCGLIFKSYKSIGLFSREAEKEKKRIVSGYISNVYSKNIIKIIEEEKTIRR